MWEASTGLTLLAGDRNTPLKLVETVSLKKSTAATVNVG